FDSRVLSAWRQHDSNVSRKLQLMLEERLSAQQRAASDLGLSAQELNHFQSLARFRSAQEFMRQGRKLIALKLFLLNMHAAPSIADALRLTGGLIVPHILLRHRKQKIRERAHERYGALTL